MPYTRRPLLRAFCLFAVSLCLLTTVQAQTTGRRRFTPREIAQTSFPSVVLIVTADAGGKPLTQGSGFFVRPDVVATNFHVIKGAAQIVVKIVGQAKEYGATTIVGVDRETDLALVKVSGVKARPLPLGAGRKIVAGDIAYALGNPKGFEGTISSGLVSGVRRDGDIRLLQFDAAISPGSSGGPVLDDRGEVIGVASLFFKEGQNLNFAVHVSHLVDLINRPAGIPSATAKKASPEREAPPSPPGGRSNRPDVAPGERVTKVAVAPPAPPLDLKAAREELIPVLRQTIRALIRGDKAAFESLLADDFVQADGLRRWNKARYLAELTPSTDVLLHVLETVDLAPDPAGNPVLTSVVRYKSLKSEVARFENVFTYAKRDGKWQILSWRSRRLSPEEGPVDPALTSPDALLFEARMDFISGKYNSVITNLRRVVEANPENAEASLLLGRSYFGAGKYKESVPLLVKAATLGQKVELPVYHHRRTSWGLDDDLIAGELIVEKGNFQYRSTSNTTVNGQSVSEPNFTVPLAKISEAKYEADKGGRLHLEVLIPKGNKEERKGLNFYPREAKTVKQYSPEKVVLDCSSCPPSMEAVYQMLMKLMGK